jgi:hypothetical protein
MSSSSGLVNRDEGVFVTLTRGQSIGLAFYAEAGFISMVASAIILVLIFVSSSDVELSPADIDQNHLHRFGFGKNLWVRWTFTS